MIIIEQLQKNFEYLHTQSCTLKLTSILSNWSALIRINDVHTFLMQWVLSYSERGMGFNFSLSNCWCLCLLFSPQL